MRNEKKTRYIKISKEMLKLLVAVLLESPKMLKLYLA